MSEIKKCLTIGPLSRLTGIPTATLRDWVRKGLLETFPNNDPKDKTLWFNPDHIPFIGIWRELRQAGYSLEFIKERRYNKKILNQFIKSKKKVNIL